MMFYSIRPTERLIFRPYVCYIVWGCRGAKWTDLDLQFSTDDDVIESLEMVGGVNSTLPMRTTNK